MRREGGGGVASKHYNFVIKKNHDSEAKMVVEQVIIEGGTCDVTVTVVIRFSVQVVAYSTSGGSGIKKKSHYPLSTCTAAVTQNLTTRVCVHERFMQR